MKTANQNQSVAEQSAEQAADKAPGVIAKGAKVTAKQVLGPVKGQDPRKLIANLESQVVALQTALAEMQAAKKGEEAQPVDDKAFEAACEQIRANVKKNPFEASTSLASILKFTPALSDTQRAEWRKVRKELEVIQNSASRNNWDHLAASMRRAKNKKNATVIFRQRLRKTDGAQDSFTIRAKKLANPIAKTPGKGKGAAKPAQIAANMPKAQNATPPAGVK